MRWLAAALIALLVAACASTSLPVRDILLISSNVLRMLADAGVDSYGRAYQPPTPPIGQSPWVSSLASKGGKAVVSKSIWQPKITRNDYMGSHVVLKGGVRGDQHWEWRWYEDLDDYLYLEDAWKADGGIVYWFHERQRFGWVHPTKTWPGAIFLNPTEFVKDIRKGAPVVVVGPPPEPRTGGVKYAKVWGLEYDGRAMGGTDHRALMLQNAKDYEIIVGTEDDLGVKWTYQGGGSAVLADSGRLRRLKNDFPNADLYLSIQWFSAQDYQLDKFPSYSVLWGNREHGVGFQAQRVNHGSIHSQILKVTNDLLDIGISPMMDYCLNDVGQEGLMRAVRDAAHSHGKRFMANVGTGEQIPVHMLDLPDIRDHEGFYNVEDQLNHGLWASRIARGNRRAQQQILLRLWPDNQSQADAIVEAHRGAVDFFQLESSPNSHVGEPQFWKLHHYGK